MGYYKSPPVLDKEEREEFETYLRQQYLQDIHDARAIALNTNNRLTDTEQELAFQVILDKLATPRIYLLQAWLHQKSQKEAGVETK